MGWKLSNANFIATYAPPQRIVESMAARGPAYVYNMALGITELPSALPEES